MASVSDVQARLTVQCNELICFFGDAGAQQRSLDLLQERISSHEFFEVLKVFSSYGKCMALIDQDVLHAKLATCWTLLDDLLNLQKANILKVIKNKEQDKSAEAAVAIAKLQNQKFELEQRRLKVLIESVKYNSMTVVPIEKFKTEPPQKLFAQYKDQVAQVVKANSSLKRGHK